ncbi:hypothetical protein GCM10017744_102340 [Streptomyces antimycoticus]|uniref:Uncharacterized protein n=1 Tax=Streptomyces antimycoticus TaxID=68175 RepID=A0A4D4KS34_9ACTN|nr:hypothetical protein [Streptomyces antimycoticus]GDY49267.1 hypothetical protein SANT12839_101490 [Streptomyces antimycoticus]
MIPRLPGPIAGMGPWIASSAPYLAGLLLGAGAAALWLAVRRAQRVREALADRVRVELIPTATFNPGEGEVTRWAHQLARIRFAASSTPSRGAAARIRYSATNGKMRCYLEGPAAAAAVLSMPGFAEVDVRTDRGTKSITPVRFPDPAQREGERQ